MWTRQEVHSEQRASLEGAPPGAEHATGRTTRVIEMRPAKAEDADTW
jgi:hypothetical protein